MPAVCMQAIPDRIDSENSTLGCQIVDDVYMHNDGNSTAAADNCSDSQTAY